MSRFWNTYVLLVQPSNIIYPYQLQFLPFIDFIIFSWICKEIALSNKLVHEKNEPDLCTDEDNSELDEDNKEESESGIVRIGAWDWLFESSSWRVDSWSSVVDSTTARLFSFISAILQKGRKWKQEVIKAVPKFQTVKNV